MTRLRCGAGIATTFPLLLMRQRSMSCWLRFPPWRLIYCPTTIRISIRPICFCRSQPCARPRLRLLKWRRNSTDGCVSCYMRRVRVGTPRQRQPRNLAQSHNQAKLCRPGRHSQPAHRECHPASGRTAEGVLAQALPSALRVRLTRQPAQSQKHFSQTADKPPPASARPRSASRARFRPMVRL